MATEHFCLRWNNHQSTLVSVFDNLLESGTLVDCTLAADGRYLKAHKVVLSACSPYLGMLLSQHYDKHPIIILKDVKFDELKAMLDYMYRGEVNISQEQLSTFLKAAETLQIKGLTDAGSEEGNGLQPNRPPSSNSTTSANEDPQSPGPPGEGGSSPGPRKRKRNKHGDDGEGDSVSKISLSEGSDRLSGTSVGSPSAKCASVKREPAEGEGDVQMSVDESGEVVMMSRPGPSNGGTNNKAPWILSADSSGEEMQLTPGQDGRSRDLGQKVQERKMKVEDSGNGPEIKDEIKLEVEDRFEGKISSWEDENTSRTENQNPSFVYTVARSEEELIIPDFLGEPTSLGDNQSQIYYQQPPKSIFMTNQIPEEKSEGNYNNSNVFGQDSHCDHQLVKKVSLIEESSKEECLKGNIERVRVNIVPKSSLHKSSKSHPSSLTVQMPSPQFCIRSLSHSVSLPAKCSKTVINVADAFDKKKVRVKKTKLDFHTSKYRKILPAPEDNSGSLGKGTQSVQNVQAAVPSNPIPPQCSITPTNLSAGDIQLEMGHSQSSSLLSIPLPNQAKGGQIINNAPNVQGSQISNTSSGILSIAPPFSISSSSVQTGSLGVQFPSSSNQVASFHNRTPQGQVSHPVFVTSNIISSCEASNQFLPSTSVQYNISTPAVQPQPNLRVPERKQSVYVRTPGGFVQVKPLASQAPCYQPRQQNGQ